VASADNKIGNEGAEALAVALKTNTSLQSLDLMGEYGGRGGEGRREERGGGRARGPHAHARSFSWWCKALGFRL